MSTTGLVETPKEAIESGFNGKAIELTRELLLKHVTKPVTIKPVDLPIGRAYVRSLPHNVREQYLIDINGVNNGGQQNLAGSEPKFAALVLCDKDGNQLLSEADVAELAKLDFDLIDKINAVGGPINGFKIQTQERVEEAKNG